MSYYIMSVFDRKAKLYAPPFTVRSLAEASRGLSEALKEPKNILSQYPSDFELVLLAFIDEVSGVVATDEGCAVSNDSGREYELLPRSIGLALDFVTGGSK